MHYCHLWSGTIVWWHERVSAKLLCVQPSRQETHRCHQQRGLQLPDVHAAVFNLVSFLIILLLLLVMTRHEWRIEPAVDSPDASSNIRMVDTLRLPIVWLLVAIFVVATGTELTGGQLANSLLVEGRAKILLFRV